MDIKRRLVMDRINAEGCQELWGKFLLTEKSPPGWRGSVTAMKKHGEIDNPFALAWHMKNKGDNPHYKNKDGNPEKKDCQCETFDKWLGQKDPELVSWLKG